MTLRHYYRCCDCLTVAATEQPLPAERATAECGACGGPIEYMGPVKRDRIITGVKPLCPCDERCTGARGPNCECQCGGENHGTHLVVAVEITEGKPRLMTRPDAKREADIYRALLSRVMNGWNTLYRAITQQKAARYLDSAEYGRYSEGQWTLKRISKAKAMRTHAGRNRNLAAILKELTGETWEQKRGDTMLFNDWDETGEKQTAANESARIDAELVSAEIRTPLTRHNLPKPLKHSTGPATLWQEPEQQPLF